jgi:protein tyrosine/serine phosphatase
MKRLTAILLAAALAGALSAQTPTSPPANAAAGVEKAARNSRWASPISLEGVPNLHQISPNLYRSEQPTALGMRNLEKLGIRTVINLRFFNNDSKEVQGTSLRTERVKILTWDIDDEHVVEVMRILRNPQNGPYLIHCQHGADRTGLMSAMYRILEQGWTVDEALAELTEGGYGYHSIWSNILRYVRSVDVEKLRSAIGLPDQPVGSTSTVTAN